MEADEEGSLSADDESWTGAHQATLEPLKSNPELSKGNAPVSSHPIEKGISSDLVSRTRIRRAREAVKLSRGLDKSWTGDHQSKPPMFGKPLRLIRKAKALVRMKDLFHLCLIIPYHRFYQVYGDLIFKQLFLQNEPTRRELQALVSDVANVKFIEEFGGLVSKGKHLEELDRLMKEIEHNLQAAEKIVAKYYVRVVSVYVKAESFLKIGISGSGGEEVARAVMDIAKMRQNFSVVLRISVCGHDRDKEVRQKIAEQIHVLQQIDHIFSLSLDQLLPHNFFLLVECLDRQMDLHDLRIPHHGILVLMTLSQEVYKIMDVDLEVSLCRHANYHGETKQTCIAIPTEVLSLFPQLNELSIDVTPDGEWWDDEQIMFQDLIDFRYIVGHRPQRIIYRLPNALEERFNRWEKKFKKCFKYINGEGMPSGIIGALKHASILFLDRHWTVKVLSEFGHENLANLECCLLVECNELQTIVDGDYECPSVVTRNQYLKGYAT
ncbi:hypothetical protein C3L33_21295, partial [Rhododendron williamsianum]